MTQTYDSFLLYHYFGQRTNDGAPEYGNEGPAVYLSCCCDLLTTGSWEDVETPPLSEGHGLQWQRRINLPHDRRHAVVHPVDVDDCQFGDAMASEAGPGTAQQDILHVESHPEECDLRTVRNGPEFVPVRKS